MGIVAIVILVLALSIGSWFMLKKEYNLAAYAVVVIALSSRLFVAADPELHDWDEQYHALVGKNFFRGDFKAELYEEQLIEYDFKEWIANGVWYSKGPVPLILIGASVELFGEYPFAVRLPSLLLGMLSVWLTFLIGKRMFNEQVAVIALFLHAIHGSLIELIGGRLSSDHVEVAFVFFVQLSFYFLIKWQQNKHPKNNLLLYMGLAVGCAFLSKWFPAFLVFPVFVVLLFLNKELSWKNRFHYLAIALFGTSVLIVPYVFVQWSSHPEEFSWMMSQLLFGADTQATFHASPWYYYIENIHAIFGPAAFLAVVYSVSKIKDLGRDKTITLLLWMLIPLLIFSVPQMKRQTYMLIAAPAYFLMIAFWIGQLLQFKEQRKVQLILSRLIPVIIIGFALVYHFDRMKYLSSPEASSFQKSEWLEFEATLNDPSKVVVFNYFECHKAMFYTDVMVYRNPLPEKTHLVFQTHEVFFYDNGTFVHVMAD